MKFLLTITAVVEAATGLALMLAPGRVTSLLLGSSLESPAAVTVARVGGAALLALGVACWLSREQGRVMVTAMLVYNLAAVVVLAHAGLGLGLRGIGLWPAVGAHTALGVWCLMCSRSSSV